MSGPVVPQNDGERELFRDIPLPDRTPKRPSLERSATFSVKAEKKTDQSLDSLVDAVLAASKYKPQSGEEVGQTISTADDNIESEVVQFSDENPGHALVVDSTYESTMMVSDDTNTSLATYLARPVEVFSGRWLQNSTYGTTLNPWALWSANRWVRAKISNYALLRCKLHVKFLINGTPFHYGKILIAYDPLPNTNMVDVSSPYGNTDICHLSQKPHVYIDPQNSAGASMVLPFFWPSNYFNLPAGDLENAGLFHLASFGNLSSAASGTNAVEIKAYAWAEDVCLAMPTSQYLPQSGSAKSSAMNSNDEYGKGIISQPASAVAKAAGALEYMPIVGPYARATSVIASGVGSLAALFGFSRPNIITDRQTYAPEHVGVLANVNAADSSTKLSLDAKQELTIDSRTVGLDGVDQMTASSIVQREAYIGTFAWAETSLQDTILWNCRVTPTNFLADNNRICMTPAALWSQQFRYWHGTMKYRFQIIKSRHHRGRLLVRWDPRLLGATVEPNAVYSRIVDIEQEDDFEIEIGWGQSHAFRQVNEITNSVVISQTSRITGVDSLFYNGVLEVDVLNQLVSPDGESPIAVIVSVSMTPDAKFGGPVGERLGNLSPFLPQSGFVPQSGEISSSAPTGAPGMSAMGSPQPGFDPTMCVFFGEHVTSLRELIKRYVHTRSVARPRIAAGNIGHIRFVSPAQPLVGGADETGPDLLRGSTTVSGTVATNGPLSLWNLCYAGWRGSLRHKYIVSDDITGPIRATRMSGPVRSYGYNSAVIPNATSLPDRTKWLSSANNLNNYNGSYVADAEYKKTLEVEVPFYSHLRFLPTRDPRATRKNGDGIQISDVVNVSGKNSLGFMDDYVAAGDDYTLFFFTGVPPLFRDRITANTPPGTRPVGRNIVRIGVPTRDVVPLTAPAGTAGVDITETLPPETAPDDGASGA